MRERVQKLKKMEAERENYEKVIKEQIEKGIL